MHAAQLDAGTYVGAPQPDTQPSHQLLEHKRLGYVVITARSETCEAVRHSVARRQEQHRR